MRPPGQRFFAPPPELLEEDPPEDLVPALDERALPPDDLDPLGDDLMLRLEERGLLPADGEDERGLVPMVDERDDGRLFGLVRSVVGGFVLGEIDRDEPAGLLKLDELVGGTTTGRELDVAPEPDRGETRGLDPLEV